MGQTVGLGELVITEVDPHNTAEPSLYRDPIDGCLQTAHAWGV